MRVRGAMMPRALFALLLAGLGPRAPAPAASFSAPDARARAPPTALPLLFAARVPSPAQAARGAPHALCGFSAPPPRAAGTCARVRRGRDAVTRAAESRRDFGKQSPRSADRASDTEVKVGVPVPLAVWDALLRVWMSGSSEAKQGIGRMAARSPLMAQILNSTRHVRLI
jgi:hypothetical protein